MESSSPDTVVLSEAKDFFRPVAGTKLVLERYVAKRFVNAETRKALRQGNYVAQLRATKTLSSWAKRRTFCVETIEWVWHLCIQRYGSSSLGDYVAAQSDKIHCRPERSEGLLTSKL